MRPPAKSHDCGASTCHALSLPAPTTSACIFFVLALSRVLFARTDLTSCRAQTIVVPEKRSSMEGVRRPTPSRGSTNALDQLAATSPRKARGDTSGSGGTSTPGGSGHPNRSSPPSPLLACRGVLKRPSSGGLPVRHTYSVGNRARKKRLASLVVVKSQKTGRLDRLSFLSLSLSLSSGTCFFLSRCWCSAFCFECCARESCYWFLVRCQTV